MPECPKGEYVVKKEVFGGEELEAIYRVARKPVANQEEIDLATSDDPMARMGQGFCPAFNQRVYEAAPGILCEQDVPVKMRDGATIYCDIFRPKDESHTYPAIVSWSWFGKRPGDGMSEWVTASRRVPRTNRMSLLLRPVLSKTTILVWERVSR